MGTMDVGAGDARRPLIETMETSAGSAPPPICSASSAAEASLKFPVICVCWRCPPEMTFGALTT